MPYPYLPFDTDIYSEHYPNFYSGLIYVFSIAILMTIFELLLFKIMIEPKEKHEFEEKVRGLHDVLKNYTQSEVDIYKSDINSNINSSYEPIINSYEPIINSYTQQYKPYAKEIYDGTIDFLKVSAIRENLLNEDINSSAISIIVLEVFIFFCIVSFCIYKLYIEARTNRKASYMIVTPILLACITCIILAGFQFLMFRAAGGTGEEGSYQYASDREIKYLIFQKLENELVPKDQQGNVDTNWCPKPN